MKNFIRRIEPGFKVPLAPLCSVHFLIFLPYLDPLNEFEIISEELDKRKLGEILSADVKGYSGLMGEDEESTIRTLSAYFRTRDPRTR